MLNPSPTSPTANTEALTAAQTAFEDQDRSGIARPPGTPGPPVPAKNTPPSSAKKVAFTGVDDENVYTYDRQTLIRAFKASWTVHAAKVAAEAYPSTTTVLVSATAMFVQRKIEELFVSVDGCKGTKGKLLNLVTEKVVMKVPAGERGRGFEEWVEGVLRDAAGAMTSGKEWMESWRNEDYRELLRDDVVDVKEMLDPTSIVDALVDVEKDERSLQLE